MTEALELLQEASAASSSNPGSSEHQRVTLAYNTARLQEAVGDYLAAKNAYLVGGVFEGAEFVTANI